MTASRKWHTLFISFTHTIPHIHYTLRSYGMYSVYIVCIVYIACIVNIVCRVIMYSVYIACKVYIVFSVYIVCYSEYIVCIVCV